MKVLGLCGYPRAGKDEAAKALTSRGWVRLSFADKVREGILAVDPIIAHQSELRGDTRAVRLKDFVENHGWDQAKRLPEVRRLLQVYGTEAGREIHGKTCWIDIVSRQIADLITSHHRLNGIVITDVRFPDEADFIAGLGGMCCFIDRSGLERPNSHSSEDYEFGFDYLITNNGTIDDLHAKILRIAGAVSPHA